MTWNGQEYPIAEWNANQNLTTAFQNSVNWYFQSLDQTAGLETLEDFYTYINYGNHDLSGGVSSFWAESSLKISPIEQVETSDNTYFFALNIGATENATGSKASDIALSILSDMNIWY